MNNLIFIDTPINEIKIALTEDIKQETWQETKGLSSEFACWRGYINLLARKVFLQWLNLILDTNFVDNIKLKDNLSIWEFINGNCLNIDRSRFVIIPVATNDKSDFFIAEEWLKIPDWVGSYYLPMEVNVEENYLAFWGFASYEDVLNYSHIDSLNHGVDFPCLCLENDLNLLPLEYEYGWDAIPKIFPLPILSVREKENLMLEIEDILSPRMVINFSHWLSLISDNATRHQLFLSRQSLNLSQWLQNKFNSAIVKGWETIETLKESYFLPDFSVSPSLSFRWSSLSESLKILTENQDKIAVNNVLKILPNLVVNDEIKLQVIAILENLIENTEEEETRWNIALALQNIDSNHQKSGIWQGKIINFREEEVALLIGILPDKDRRIDIFVRVSCAENNSYLPSNLALQIIDEEDNIFQEIKTRNYDNIIQYKFWGNPGEKFKLKLQLQKTIIEEYFII